MKQSVVHRYRFDPEQRHKLSPGERVKDPETERLAMEKGVKASSPGTLVRIDPVAGNLDLKRGRRSTASHPRHLIPATSSPEIPIAPRTSGRLSSGSPGPWLSTGLTDPVLTAACAICCCGDRRG